ncbi:hypothetical protein J0I05_01820 [Candidatus Saccharibacteria bacterium]|nr:hypothetical protein [Candidatus Saccharibacteria bacterium]
MIEREILESLAIDAVCACLYYDLQDTLEETPDKELLAIINRTEPCEVCGQIAAVGVLL